MPTGYTSLLGLALPVTGELDGSWGDTVNNSLTKLVDSAVAGTTTLSTDADVTLSTTQLAANQARQIILLCTGNRSTTRTITAPAQSKVYVIINATTASVGGPYAVKLVATGPTSGVTVNNGKYAVVAWNGSDFVYVSGNDLTAMTGTLPVANGGTGVTTSTGTGSVVLSASPALTGTPTAPTASPGTNTTQVSTTAFVTAAISAVGAVTSVTASSPLASSGGTTPNLSLTGAVPVANGGTGATSTTGSGANVLGTSPTLTTPNISSIVNTGTLTLPTSTDTLVGRATTDTLTNKSINPRVVSIADGTSVTINADTTDIATQANTQSAGTLTINAPTGTPFNGQKLIFRLQSTNNQTFSWNSIFAGSADLALPTVSSGSSKYDYVGFMYNSTASKWQLLAKVFGF